MKNIRVHKDIALAWDDHGHAIVRPGGTCAEQIQAIVTQWMDTHQPGSEEREFVSRWYEAWSRKKAQAPQVHIVLPPGRDYYFAKGLSRCHGQRQLLVRSRTTFISKNCLDCGAPDYVGPAKLPQVLCPNPNCCRVPLQIATVYQTGYVCSCGRCREQRSLASLLPRWHELFLYRGLAAYGDWPFT